MNRFIVQIDDFGASSELALDLRFVRNPVAEAAQMTRHCQSCGEVVRRFRYARDYGLRTEWPSYVNPGNETRVAGITEP